MNKVLLFLIVAAVMSAALCKQVSHEGTAYLAASCKWLPPTPIDPVCRKFNYPQTGGKHHLSSHGKQTRSASHQDSVEEE
jgi:hypothetical protein